MKMFLPRTLENIPLQAAANLDLRRCLIRTIELIGKAFDPKIMKKSHNKQNSALDESNLPTLIIWEVT
jgi:hypothetical protein